MDLDVVPFSCFGLWDHSTDSAGLHQSLTWLKYILFLIRDLAYSGVVI